MPYAQGELDGLCGVYAIVNAVENTVAGWKIEDAEGLFKHLVTRLSGQGRLHTAIADGIGVRELCRLIDHAGAYLADEYGVSLKRRIAFARPVPLSSYWLRLQEHLQGRGHTAIVGLWGKHEHWSCVLRMTGRTVHLLDSGLVPIRRIYRANCTTAQPNERRHHEVSATMSILISIGL